MLERMISEQEHALSKKARKQDPIVLVERCEVLVRRSMEGVVLGRGWIYITPSGAIQLEALWDLQGNALPEDLYHLEWTGVSMLAHGLRKIQ